MQDRQDSHFSQLPLSSAGKTDDIIRILLTITSLAEGWMQWHRTAIWLFSGNDIQNRLIFKYP